MKCPATSAIPQTPLLDLDYPVTAETSPTARRGISGHVQNAETKGTRDALLQLVGREAKIALLNHKINDATTTHKARSHYRAELRAVTHSMLGAA